MKILFCLPLIVLGHFFSHSQGILQFPVDDINNLILNGTVQVSYETLDIGSINDVFDGNYQTLARTASINPQVITLKFPFRVTFSGSEILQTYGDGWWSLDAADTDEDLIAHSGSYVGLLNMLPLTDGVIDSKSFGSQSKKIIRMTVHRSTGDDYVHLNEWKLLDATAEVEITNVCARPSQLWMIPNSTLEISVFGTDAQGLQYPVTNNLIFDVAADTLISVETSNGHNIILSNNNLGSTTLSIQWNSLQQVIPVHIINDFKPETAPTRIAKVALVLIDPPIAAEGGLRFHERFGWDDPVDLTNALIDSFRLASGGAVEYEIVATYDETELYALFQGNFISVDSMYRLFLEPGWVTFHQLEQNGGYEFDYNGLLAAHDFCTQSNNHEIDEIWVYSMPFTGMYESRLTGDGAFWYNSPPLTGNTCVDQLPIMGWNYERGVAEAMHSFGHRVESAMAHTFGRWDYNAVEKNDWEIFASYDKANPGEANIGNIHYPPNGISDYDYENPSSVVTHADNWLRYPFLFNEQRTVTCSEWDCSQLGYMSWWFHHLPHFTCKNRIGLLNNWWSYIIDYNEGKLLEKELSDCQCEYVESITSVDRPNENATFNIYPNPAKDSALLVMKESATEIQSILIWDQQGQVVKNFILEKSLNSMSLDLKDLPSGIYHVVLKNAQHIQSSGQVTIIGN
jgi:hypothetical protein